MTRKSKQAKKPGEKRRGRASKAERAEALHLLNSGLPVAEVSKRTGFREQVLRKWQSPATTASAPGFPSLPKVQTSDDPPHAPGDPAKAFAAIGAQAPGEEETDSQSSTPGSSLPPPPTPEQLLQLVKGVDGLVMKGIAGAKYSGLDPAEVAEICAMPPEEVEALAVYAPYAADYAPLVLQYMKPAMACVFVLTWSFSVVGRTKALARAHAERFPPMSKAVTKAAERKS